VRTDPLGSKMYKQGPHLAHISAFTVFMVFRRLSFFTFLECFLVISSCSIAVHIGNHYYFSTVYGVLASGHPSADSPWSKPLVTPLHLMELTVVLQIRAVHKASSSILQ